jgi:hypothetical protein
LNQVDAHTLQDGYCVLYARKKLVTTPKTPMKARSRRRAGSGVRIAVWFKCSLSKQTVNGNKVCMIQNREPTQTVCQIRYKIRKSVRLGRSYLASSGKRFFPFSVILIAPICLNISMLSVTFQYSASLPLTMR